MVFFNSCENQRPNSGRITFRDALMYNKFIVDRHKELIADIDIYNLAIEHDYPFALKTLDSILLHASKSVSDVDNMAAFRGDSSFREVSKDFFKYYAGQFIDEEKVLVGIKSKADSGFASTGEILTFSTLSKRIDAHATALQMRMQEMQRRFARKNNFTLSE